MKSKLYALLLYFLLLCCSIPGFGLALLYALGKQLNFKQLAHELNLKTHYILFALPLKLMPIWRVVEDTPSKTKRNPKLILVSNHLSLIDAMLIASTFIEHNYRIIFVGRSGQDKIPLVGWSLKLLGHAFIEFKTGNKAVGNSVRAAMGRLHNEVTNTERVAVVFFVTGLFQNPKEDPLQYEFKNGPFTLAKALNIRVLPIWLSGTDKALPPSDPFSAHPAVLSLSANGEGIPPGGNTIEDMKHKCKVEFSSLR